MFAQIEYPETLLPADLDAYLARGWFRMRQSIFTTHFLHFRHLFYSAVWLRVALSDSIYDKKYNALTKLNKAFRTEIKQCVGAITAQQESLYECYRKSLSFEVSPSLQELLFGQETVNIFDTYQVNIYDGDLLIAVGFFDLGDKSAAGISCIYRPAYKKYSLGKYLMYLKMDFCNQRQMQYFYPGYVVPGYMPFDYKLEIGKASLQYLQLATQQWVAFSPPAPIANPLDDMLEKLVLLQAALQKKEIPNAILHYRFFEVNLDPFYYRHELFDYPVFVYCFPVADASFYTIIVYDVCNGRYQLVLCSSAANISLRQHISVIFDSDLLKVERELFTTAVPEEMSGFISGLFENI